MRKYEFTGEVKVWCDGTVRRIRRCADGLVGGWIESEDNLSHEDVCFVFSEAVVCGSARVVGAALVCEFSSVSDSAYICDAQLLGTASVDGEARVEGPITLCGRTHLGGRTIIRRDTYASCTELQLSHRIVKGTWINGLPISIVANKHVITHTGPDEISIGCHRSSFEELRQSRERLAKAHGYTPEDVIECMEIIDFLSKRDARIFPNLA